ncbi:MAG: PEP-CTERM sorting domain-containing protein [Candidatus Thiodiazotropha sp.]
MSKKENRRHVLKGFGVFAASVVIPAALITGSASANGDYPRLIRACDHIECPSNGYYPPDDYEPPVSVPEPSTLGLMTIGLGAMVFARKRRKKKEQSEK